MNLFLLIYWWYLNVVLNHSNNWFHSKLNEFQSCFKTIQFTFVCYHWIVGTKQNSVCCAHCACISCFSDHSICHCQREHTSNVTSPWNTTHLSFIFWHTKENLFIFEDSICSCWSIDFKLNSLTRHLELICDKFKDSHEGM